VIGELEAGYSKVLKELTGYEQQVDWDKVDNLEWPTFEENIDKLAEQAGSVAMLDSELKNMLQLANEINIRLREI